MLALSIAQAAYIAALVDGEGTIGLSVGRNKTYSPRVGIANTSTMLLQSVRTDTGIGEIIRKSSKVPGRKIVCVWYLKVWEMKEFLPVIKPYLRLKDFQADLLIEYLAMGKSHRFNPLTDNKIHTRRVIFELLAELNKRGD